MLSISQAARSSKSTSIARNSKARRARDTNDTTMIATMNNDASCTPSGRSMILAMVVYTNTAATTPNPMALSR